MSENSDDQKEPWVDAHGNLGASGGVYYVRNGSEATKFSLRTKLITLAIFAAAALFMLWLALT